MINDPGSWMSIFRILGEIKNSCQEVEDELNMALRQVDSLRNYVMSMDKVLMQKYNYESIPKEKSND